MGLEQQPHGANCKSPFRRNGRSRSTICKQTPSEDCSQTPRHHKRKGDSASPTKGGSDCTYVRGLLHPSIHPSMHPIGRTPRRRADRSLTCSLLCQEGLLLM